MRIKTKLSQHRRDFTAIYECEHCGHELKGDGYDDAYFHNEIIPSIKCPSCRQTAVGPSSTPDVPAGVIL